MPIGTVTPPADTVTATALPATDVPAFTDNAVPAPPCKPFPATEVANSVAVIPAAETFNPEELTDNVEPLSLIANAALDAVEDVVPSVVRIIPPDVKTFSIKAPGIVNSTSTKIDRQYVRRLRQTCSVRNYVCGRNVYP